MGSSNRLGVALQQGTDFLARHKRDAPRLSAELILCRAMRISRLELLLSQDRLLSRAELLQAWEMLEQRARGCPLAYILGCKEFYGLEFQVGPQVLIPRPETELLLDLVQKLAPWSQELVFADLGTGSGALGIAMLCLYPRSRGLLMDISPAALRWARENASQHQVLHRCQLAVDDLGASLGQQSLDAILANPPYLSSSDMAELSREIRDFEPLIALWGGPGGQEKALRMLQNTLPSLKPGGWCLLEAAPQQIAELLLAQELFTAYGLQFEVHQDLAGKDRVLALHKVCA
ncbi:MAG: peptide chain release factor N(5)-glutamine methyltransferase [Desulfohalobiaceae bacterium]